MIPRIPSITPTGYPTPKTPFPTISAPPSDLPSVIPTAIPSDFPSDYPSTLPSFGPSPSPTGIPSQAPSFSLQSLDARVKMTLKYSDKLQSLSIITWERETSSHIRQSIVNADIDPILIDLRVYTNIIRQTSQQQQQQTSSTNGVSVSNSTIQQAKHATVRRRRHLQEGGAQDQIVEDDNVPLTIAFDTAIEFRSIQAYNQTDVQTWISFAFDTNEDRDAYVERLKRTADASFQRLEEIDSVIVGGKEIHDEPEEPPPSGGDDRSSNDDMTMIFLIIGAAAGGGALLLLLLFFLYRYITGRNKTTSTTKADSRSDPTNPNAGVTTEIVVENNPDEVSTLGDPLFSGMMIQHMERDERTARYV